MASAVAVVGATVAFPVAATLLAARLPLAAVSARPARGPPGAAEPLRAEPGCAGAEPAVAAGVDRAHPVGGARLRRIAPVAGASSVAGRLVTDPRPGCPATEPADEDPSGRASERSGVAIDRSDADIRAPDARGARAPGTGEAGVDADVAAEEPVVAAEEPVVAAEEPVVVALAAIAGANQVGRTEPPGRTAGRSSAEPVTVEGNWERRIEGNAPLPTADGIEACPVNPMVRRIAVTEPAALNAAMGWRNVDAATSEAPEDPAAAWPAALADRLIGRRLAMPSGRPARNGAAGVPSGRSLSAGAVLAAVGAGSAAACRPRPGAACGAEPADPE